MYAAAGGASIASRRKQKRRSREEQLIRRQRQLQQIQQIQQLVQQQRRSAAVGSGRASAPVRVTAGAPRSLVVGGQQQPVRQSSPLPGAPLLVPGLPVRCCSPYGRSPHGRTPRQRQRENEHRDRNEEARKHERHETRRSQPPLSRERTSRSHHHRHRPGVFYERSPATDCHSHRHFRTREPPERETFFPRCRATESDDRFVFSSSCDKDADDGDENEDGDGDDDDGDDDDADDDDGDRDNVGKGKSDNVRDCTHCRRGHPDDTDDDDGDFDGNDDDGDSRARSVVDSRLSASNSDSRCGGAQTAGKAAWQGCNKKRGSPLPLAHGHPPHTCRESEGYSRTKQCEAHRRWMKKRNRIRDASHCYYGSTDDEEDYDYDDDDDEDDERINRNRRRGEVSAAVNTVLYAGLGTTALGLVISFVGTGEKGFLSTELKLLGPSLLCAGLLCCFLRVLLCVCGHQCGCRRFLRRRMEKKKGDVKSKKAPPASNRPQQQTGRGPLPTASSQASTLPTTTLHLSPIRYARKETKQKQGSQAHSLQSQTSSTMQQNQQQQQHPPPHTYQSQQTELFQLNQQHHHDPQKQSVTTAVKGHELLLSPAQLPE